MTSRGTRPMQPQRWGRRAEGIRREAESIGVEIVALVKKHRETTNTYEQRLYLSEIETLGERITRLMLQATQGAPAEEDEE